MFLTSHDAGDIEQLCKRVIVINHGSIILNTSVSTLRRQYLQHKIIDLKLQDPIPPEGLVLPGATMLKTSTYGAKLQVDTAATTMEAIISTLVGHYQRGRHHHRRPADGADHRRDLQPGGRQGTPDRDQDQWARRQSARPVEVA